MKKEYLLGAIILFLLVVILIGIPTNKKKSEEPNKNQITVTSPIPPAIKEKTKRELRYIKFYDVKIGEEFTYLGRIFVKISNEYWWQPNNQPINGNLWYPPGTFSPKPINNAQGKWGLVHFDANMMVLMNV